MLIQLKLLFLGLTFSSLALAAQPFHIMIDPGHGGSDKGAHNHDVLESTLALEVAKKLQSLLQTDANFKVTLTRQSDIHVSLNERVRLAHRKKADAFVSIHLNMALNSTAQGLEVYYQNQLNPDEESQFLASQENQGHQAKKKQWNHPATPPQASEDLKNILNDLHRSHRLRRSFSLAKSIHKNWTHTKKRKNTKIDQAPFYVLTQTHVPAVLVELGFLSNPKELRQLQNKKHQNKIAHSLYQGLKHFYKKQL